MRGKWIRVPALLLAILCAFLHIAVIFYWVFQCMKYPAPLNDGIWTNSDGSFVLNTDIYEVSMPDDAGRTIKIAYNPEPNFVMLYFPTKEPGAVDAAEIIHKGEIYQILWFIHIRCEDGCFDEWLTRAEQ